MNFRDALEADKKGAFIKNEKSSLNFGISEDSYWVRFTLNDQTTSQKEWYLETLYPAIDLYTLYLPDGKGGYIHKTAGDSVPFDEWDIAFFHPTFNLGISLPTNMPIYMNVRTAAVVNISLVLQDSKSFIEHVAALKFGLAFYYGILISLIIYNFFLYLNLRDKNYLLYVIFIMTHVIAQFTYNGLGFQYLWPSGNWIANFSYGFFLTLFYIPLVLFSQSFLNFKKYLPKINVFLNILVAYYTLILCLTPFIEHKITTMLTVSISVVTLICIYISALQIYFKGFRPARFFLLGWTIYLLGVFTVLLKMLGIFPHNYITEYSVQFGSAIEGLLLSLALADRISILKKEKEIAQIVALEETKKSEELMATFLEESEKLVEERTRELQDTKDALEKLAREDKLTGLFNRRVFDEVFLQEFSRAQRSNLELSLLVIDIDMFKKYNDRYGHQKGDECLRSVAECMQKNVKRITDTLARYGGEEFAVILTETNVDEAFSIAENIRNAVENLNIPHEDSPFEKVTISVGLATLKKGDDHLAKDFFNIADSALYKAKESGRNKTLTT